MKALPFLRWFWPFALFLSVSACVTALEPPQVSSGGREAPNERTSFDRLGLSVSTVASQLDTPWDLVTGPDGWIWFTERPGRVSRLNPKTGDLQLLAEIESLETGESGLMGMTFHPDFQSNPYVYFSQTYRENGRIANRLIRLRYSNGTLNGLEELYGGIPGNSYHDGSRLAAGPDGYLYMTTGDAGNARLAQDTGSPAGKILRFTFDGTPAPGNPFGNEVFSYGHRNPQGLVFHPASGRLYITEHGPSDNDEVSIIRSGENYGWPEVHGFCDGDIRGEEEFCSTHEVAEPIAAWTPTIAPAGADFYLNSLIPGWDGSLLFVTLKGSALVRLTLSDDGSRVLSQQVISEGEYGRLRDVLVGSDGTVYLATSNRDGRGRPAAQDDRILAIRPR